MHTERITTGAVIAAIAIAFAGCATTTAPKGFLDKRSELQTEAFGAWIRVEYYEGSEPSDLAAVTEGEFIALHEYKIYVLTENDVAEIPITKVLQARLTTYYADYWYLPLWTLVGTVSTASHGWYLALTAPMWIITGIASTIGQSHAPIEKYPRLSRDELRKFARFPQGLPQGLDLSRLKPKIK